MKIEMMKMLSVAVVVGALATVGCCKKSDTEPVKAPGTAEKAGAALDRAADKTVDVTTNAVKKATEATKAAAEATKEATGKAVEKTGEALQKAGAAVEKAGANLQQ